MERYEEAIEDEKKAIERDPNNAQYYDSRGVTLHEMKRYEEALVDKNRAIELDPNNAKMTVNMTSTLNESVTNLAMTYSVKCGRSKSMFLNLPLHH